jgi:hypothetical protein
MSPEKQQEYVHDFTVNAYKSAIRTHEILSRPGVTFTRRQKWMIYCLSDHGFFGTIKKWLLQKIILGKLSKNV